MAQLSYQRAQLLIGVTFVFASPFNATRAKLLSKLYRVKNHDDYKGKEKDGGHARGNMNQDKTIYENHFHNLQAEVRGVARAFGRVFLLD